MARRSGPPNKQKHGVSFTRAQYALGDPDRVIAEDVVHRRFASPTESARSGLSGAGYWRKGKDETQYQKMIRRLLDLYVDRQDA